MYTLCTDETVSKSMINNMYQLKAELQKANGAEKVMVGTWLLLPLIFLLERTPADFSISLIVILFLVNSYLKNDWGWLRFGWIVACFLIALTGFLSGLLSELPTRSAVESVVWLRFPIFAMASFYILGKFRVASNLLLTLTGCGLLVLFFILSIEITYNYSMWSEASGGFGGRLYWPYGDPVPGNYIAKFGLICLLATLARLADIFQDNIVPKKKNDMREIVGAFIFILLFVSFIVLTGERINTLIVICSLVLGSVLVFWSSKKLLILTILMPAAVLPIAFILNPYIANKFVLNFFSQVWELSQSGYWHLWMSALDAFASNKLLGIGPGNFRYLCGNFEAIFAEVTRCDNHPHNFIAQILAETGLVGFGAYLLFVIVLISHFLKRAYISNLHSILFIIPLAFFFPFKSNADFFGQWNNLMMWYGIGIALNLSARNRTKNYVPN